MTIVQDIYYIHCTLWFPLMVFWKYTSFSFFQKIKKNTKKSCSIDYWGFLYVINIRIEVITSLILLYLYLNKISRRQQLRLASLPKHHVLNSLLDEQYSKNAKLHWLLLGHEKQIKAAVMDLNGTDIFLGYDLLTKHNPEVNWDTGTIQFTRCLKMCRI